jgi:hypothetical protein
MAAAHVAGIAALYWEKIKADPANALVSNLAPLVKQALIANLIPLPSSWCRADVGQGFACAPCAKRMP